MNLPQLTALIGEQVKSNKKINNDLAMLVKSVENKEQDKQAYIVYLTFDLPNRQIRIEEPVPFNEDDHVYEFNYFGNNSSAGLQYYVTREVSSSLHYLLSSTLNDLAMVLQRNDLDQGELYTQLRALEEHQLVTFGTKKGHGTVALHHFHIDTGSKVALDNKKIKLDGEVVSNEQFVIRALGFDAKLPHKFTLITPLIITLDQEVIVLAQHPDYIAVTKKEQKLEVRTSKKTTTENFCYICHKSRPDASSSLTTKFSRSGINKLFTTTTINASKQINSNLYDDNYAICTDCFQYLLFGEQEIGRSFQSRIAGERTFIIPEGLEGNFEYRHLVGLKKNVDLAFSTTANEEWLTGLDLEQDEALDGSGYLVHFLLYRTDGNSVTVIETFEDVPVLHIRKVIETLATHAYRLQPQGRGMKLDDVYRLIPVHTNKKGEQLDVHRVLTLYKSMLCKYRIDSHVFFQYALEALDKGLNQLAKEQSQQFPNMRLTRFRGKTDFYIHHIIMKYICLIQSLQALGLLDREPFHYKEVVPLSGEENKRNLIEDTERFLENNGFKPEQKSLFYLGALLSNIGSAQYRKGHHSKPILNKIQYQGMNRNEVMRLYLDLREKVTQYKRGEKPGWLLDCDRLSEKFHYYAGNVQTNDWLSELQNVFFIMSGYAFMVQYYSKKEIQEIEASKEDEDTNDNEQQ